MSDVDTLKAMFPDVEADTLSAVLVSCDHQVSQAIEVLLSMSSPDAEPPATVPGNTISADEAAAAAAQCEQDEELARQLQQQLLVEDQLEAQEHQRQLQIEQQWMQQQQRQQQLQGGGGNYPGQGVLPAGRGWAYGGGDYYAGTARPAPYGAGPPPTEEAGGTVSEALYNGASSVAAGVGSLFSWIAGTDEEGAAKKRDGPPRARSDEAPEMREMQPMSRAPDDDLYDQPLAGDGSFGRPFAAGGFSAARAPPAPAVDVSIDESPHAIVRDVGGGDDGRDEAQVVSAGSELSRGGMGARGGDMIRRRGTSGTHVSNDLI